MRRKHPAMMRRTSSGTTPPHLLERQMSMPSSPQLARSERASMSFFEPPAAQTPRRQRNSVYMNGSSHIRPVSREGPTYIREGSPAFVMPSLSRAQTTSAVTEMTVNKSRLPRQATNSRLSRQPTRESLVGSRDSGHATPTTLTPVAESRRKENQRNGPVEVTVARRNTARRTAVDDRWS